MNRDQPDTFICHAGEDKEAIAKPIYKALKGVGVDAWLDDYEIRLGQSIRRKIDERLANCRSGTVILSRPFFSKDWVQYEMDGIVGRHMRGEILLFPIQHGITIEEIRDHSPSLAELSLWSSADHSPTEIACEIAGRLGIAEPTPIQGPSTARSEPGGEPEGQGGVHAFGTFYIAPAGTRQLSPNEEPETDALHHLLNPTDFQGWIPLVESREELEYVIEEQTLRVRLDWGRSWSGREIQAVQMISGEKPFALTIRHGTRKQVHFPAVINRSPTDVLVGTTSRSGWMKFLIQRS